MPSLRISTGVLQIICVAADGQFGSLSAKEIRPAPASASKLKQALVHVDAWASLMQRDSTTDALKELASAYSLLSPLAKLSLLESEGEDGLLVLKHFGHVCRSSGRLQEALETYRKITDHYLQQLANPIQCSHPEAMNHKPLVGDVARSNENCVFPFTLRFYAQHVMILARRLGQASQAQQYFRILTRVGRVSWTNSKQLPPDHVKGLIARPIWMHSSGWREGSFLIAKLLEENASQILGDLRTLLTRPDVMSNVFGHQPDTDDYVLVERGSWTEAVIIPHGMFEKDMDPSASGCVLAPNTCALFASHYASLRSELGPRGDPREPEFLPGGVSFARLAGGTHLVPHTGPTNVRLTVHLPLVVPRGIEEGGSGKPSMRVADETVQWQEGKALIFDDSFEHEVWHNGTEPRYILHLNIWHPSYATGNTATADSKRHRNTKMEL